MDMQSLLDALSEAARTERSHYHLTLGGLIARLKTTDPTRAVVFDRGGSPGLPHSYRGYYSDLAFEDDKPITAGELLAICEAALGATFEGYKGGDFIMAANTPLWSAAYGCCGNAIMAAEGRPDKLILITKNVD